jgi:hypothetical protein
VRRELSVLLVILLALIGCTGGEPPPEPEPDPEPVPETTGPSGLRVGIVLPPADTAPADEIDLDRLSLQALADDLEEVAELRAVVPDSAAFVGDVAGLLADEGYGLVCVLGDGGQQVVLDLAVRHSGVEVCAVPGDPELDVGDNVLLAELEVEQLGHVVGAALGALVGDDVAEVHLAAERTGLEPFRQGLRVGFDGGGLRQLTGDLEELEEELADIDDDVAALAFDAGVDGADLASDMGATRPTLVPAPLLGDEDAALRWRVRWDRIVEEILAWELDGDLDRPTSFGFAEGAFELTTGGRSTSAMRAVVDTVAGELARGERQALEVEDEDEDEEGDEDG